MAEADQLHQILFDESVHMMSVYTCHWNADIDDPEQTSMAMVRISKQEGRVLAKRVRGECCHIPSVNILSALSDKLQWDGREVQWGDGGLLEGFEQRR